MQSTDPIDRLTPTMDPGTMPLIHQDWHHLLFLHWEVPAAMLQPLLPAGLDLDTFEGKAYVGLVPFTLTGVRAVMTPPLPWISTFHEVNVRTYVHLGGVDPGVWFFSLDASSVLAVGAARAAYRLPYFHSRIDFHLGEGSSPRIRFDALRDDLSSGQGAHVHVEYAPVEGPFAPASAGTLEHFLVERYILYALDDSMRLQRARVHHQPYPLQKAEVFHLDETAVWAAGIRRGEEAPLRHYAREVNVKVYPLESC